MRWSALLLFTCIPCLFAEQHDPLQLWYWHHSFLTSDEAVASSKKLIDRAANCGYTGLAFWDNSFAYMSDSFWAQANVQRLQEVMEYADRKGLRVMAPAAPFGWSNPALAANGNWAEGQRVIGARFKVAASGRELELVNSFPALSNGGFENGLTAWSGTHDPGIGIAGFGHSGAHSGAIVDASGNARFRQKILLTPWRQYHLRLWFKSSRFHGNAEVELQDWWHRRVVPFHAEMEANGTHNWTAVDYTFNSRSTLAAYLYFGVWGGNSGVLWFDDVKLEETALVYVVRRQGTPLRIYDPNDPRTVYQEARDFNDVSDPRLAPPRAVFRDDYHSPPTVTLPSGTRLRAGQAVAMDFYAIFPIGRDHQVGMCLTEPAVSDWLRRNAAAIKAILPRHSGILLSYDEMRQVNSCASCRAKNLSAGELLAWNVSKTINLYQAEFPGTKLYIWNDMFDPDHNAINNYYYVEGNLRGSWKGLPSSVSVLNWNHAHLKDSLQWFAGVNSQQPAPHHQVIAGYYDAGKGNVAEDEFAQASGLPGIDGIMYVSWQDDYSQLEHFAESARRGWSSYSSSIHSTSSH